MVLLFGVGARPRRAARGVAVAVAVEDEDVRVVEEPVHRGAGEDWVAEERTELADVALGGDDGGAALVAAADDLVEVEGLFAAEWPEAEVVDDEEVGSGEAKQPPLEAPSPRLARSSLSIACAETKRTL